MNDYQDLVKKLSQINEGASIVTLDVNSSSNDMQQLKSVLVGMVLSSGAQISATFQAPCYDTLLDALETFFNVQAQIVEQAIDQVNIMSANDGQEAPIQPGMDAGMGMAPAMDAGMGDDMDIGASIGGEMEPEDDSIPAFDANGEPNGIGGEDEYGFDLGSDEPMGDDLTGDDVVVDTDDMAPEVGTDVDADEARYSHNYSFRNNGTGLFQSLTGEQRIKKGALKTAKRRLGY